jgi:hypothetical protein
VREADATWIELDQIVTEHGLPDRMIDAMFDAVLGYRLRRATYIRRAEVTDQTATRDLAALASEGILTAHGNGRGRFYTAGEPIRQIQERRRARREPLQDPYPWMRAKLSLATTSGVIASTSVTEPHRPGPTPAGPTAHAAERSASAGGSRAARAVG